MRGENRGDCLAIGFRHMVAVFMSYLLDDSMRSQEPKLAADPARASTLLRLGAHCMGEEKSLHIFVAKAVEDELPAIHGVEQSAVRLLEGPQSGHPLPLPGGGRSSVTYGFPRATCGLQPMALPS